MEKQTTISMRPEDIDLRLRKVGQLYTLCKSLQKAGRMAKETGPRADNKENPKTEAGHEE